MLRFALLVLEIAVVVCAPEGEGYHHVVYVNQPPLLYTHGAAPVQDQVNPNQRTALDPVPYIFIPVIQISSPTTSRRARVVLTGTVQGTLTLTQARAPKGPTTIQGTITGLTPGLHGFHVHEFGDLSGGCVSAGGHYNPQNQVHGAPTALVRHVGDLGNILADNTGTARVSITDNRITLVGSRSVVGRAVVVHAGQDDLGLGGNPESLTTGNAGGRVACGIIGRA